MGMRFRLQIFALLLFLHLHPSLEEETFEASTSSDRSSMKMCFDTRLESLRSGASATPPPPSSTSQ